MSDKVKSDLKKGEGKYGTAVPYAPYVNYGTRFMSAQPFLSSSIEIVRRKATGTYKKEMGKAINKGLRKRFRQQISKNVEFVGADLDLPIDEGAEESLLTLLAVGITEAKAM